MFFADPEQVRMNQMATRHEILDFMRSLNKEQMDGLTTMLNTMLGPEAPSMAAFFMGTALQVEHQHHGTCGCGMEHERAEDLLGKTEAAAPINLGTEPIRDHPFRSYSGMTCDQLITAVDGQGLEYGTECARPASEHVMSASLDPTEPPRPIKPWDGTPEGADAHNLLGTAEAAGSIARENLLREYNVAFEIDGHTVKCLGCGMQYVSLRDRMIKEPDDCHGCHLKSANG